MASGKGTPGMFIVHHSPVGGVAIRFAFGDRAPEDVSRQEARTLMRLGPSVAAVNAFLATLDARGDHASGTVREYAKALRWGLEWLAAEPVLLGGQGPVGHSLLTLEIADLSALFAWLDLPATREGDRAYLARTGELPHGFRALALSRSTHNLRVAAFFRFYEFLVEEYAPRAGGVTLPAANPLAGRRRRTVFEAALVPDGLLPQPATPGDEPKRPLRLADPDQDVQALWPSELRLVLDVVPTVSKWRNGANRNGAMLRLLTWGMLRSQELADLTWEAIEEQTLVVCGKGGKTRRVPIVEPGTWQFLDAYTLGLDTKKGAATYRGALLRHLKADGQPITVDAIEEVVRALRKHFHALAVAARPRDPRLALVYERIAEKLHPHGFRKTGATYFAAGGMNRITLARLLGHASPVTTERYYIAAEQLQLQEAVRLVHERRAIEVAAAAEGGLARVRARDADGRGWYRRQGSER